MFSVLKMSGVRLKILPEHKTVDIIRNMQGEYMTEAGNNYSEKKTQLHISVRNLVEFIFRELIVCVTVCKKAVVDYVPVFGRKRAKL